MVQSPYCYLRCELNNGADRDRVEKGNIVHQYRLDDLPYKQPIRLSVSACDVLKVQ